MCLHVQQWWSSLEPSVNHTYPAQARDPNLRPQTSPTHTRSTCTSMVHVFHNRSINFIIKKCRPKNVLASYAAYTPYVCFATTSHLPSLQFHKSLYPLPHQEGHPQSW